MSSGVTGKRDLAWEKRNSEFWVWDDRTEEYIPNDHTIPKDLPPKKNETLTRVPIRQINHQSTLKNDTGNARSTYERTDERNSSGTIPQKVNIQGVLQDLKNGKVDFEKILQDLRKGKTVTLKYGSPEQVAAYLMIEEMNNQDLSHNSKPTKVYPSNSFSKIIAEASVANDREIIGGYGENADIVLSFFGSGNKGTKGTPEGIQILFHTHPKKWGYNFRKKIYCDIWTDPSAGDKANKALQGRNTSIIGFDGSFVVINP